MLVAALFTIVQALDFAISILNFILIVYIIIGWLRVFKVGFAFHPVVSQIFTGLHALIDPLLALIRRVIPTQFGGIDIAPIVLVGGLWLLRQFLRTWALQIVNG